MHEYKKVTKKSTLKVTQENSQENLNLNMTSVERNILGLLLWHGFLKMLLSMFPAPTNLTTVFKLIILEQPVFTISLKQTHEFTTKSNYTLKVPHLQMEY